MANNALTFDRHQLYQSAQSMTLTRVIYGALTLWLLYDGATRANYLSFLLAALVGLMAWRNVSCPLGLCAPSTWQQPNHKLDSKTSTQEVEYEEI